MGTTTPKDRFANKSFMNWDVTLEIARGNRRISPGQRL